MSTHINNIVNGILQEVENGLDRFADSSGMSIHLFEHDSNGIYVNYQILPRGRVSEAIERIINKKIDELVNGNNTRILYHREDKERYVMKNDLVFKWNDIVVDEILPTIERGIKDNITQNIAVEESYLEDYIVDYEENDSRGEDSYYVSEYDVSNELDYLKTSIHVNTDFKEFLGVNTLVDKWEDRQR